MSQQHQPADISPASRSTLRELAARVAAVRGIAPAEAEALCQALFNTVAEALADGNAEVKVDPLGTFAPASQPQGVAFVASEEFAQAVNAPFSCFSPVDAAPEADIEAPEEPEEQPAVAEPEVEIVLESEAAVETAAGEPEANPAAAEVVITMATPPPYRPRTASTAATAAVPPPWRGPGAPAAATDVSPLTSATAMPQLQETPSERRSSLWLAIIVCVACAVIGFIIGLFCF